MVNRGCNISLMTRTWNACKLLMILSSSTYLERLKKDKPPYLVAFYGLCHHHRDLEIVEGGCSCDICIGFGQN